MICLRLRTKWQNCRGYVPRYERTPKNGWFDIHSVFATHVETVCLLPKLHEAKHHVSVTLDMDEMDLHKLIVLLGNSGSGKITVAKELQKVLGSNTMD